VAHSALGGLVSAAAPHDEVGHGRDQVDPIVDAFQPAVEPSQREVVGGRGEARAFDGCVDAEVDVSRVGGLQGPPAVDPRAEHQPYRALFQL